MVLKFDQRGRGLLLDALRLFLDEQILVILRFGRKFLIQKAKTVQQTLCSSQALIF